MVDSIVRYLTHPQVIVEEGAASADWVLSEIGEERVRTFAARECLRATKLIVTSDERKAVQTGELIAAQLQLAIEVRPGMGEVDRSTTGYLPDREFSANMDRFFR